MLLFLLYIAPTLFRLFQTANGVGSLFAKSEKIRIKLVPQRHAGLFVESFSKFKRQRAMTGASDILAKLVLVWRENTDAAAPA
jgi:hypothetical protein